MKSFQNKFLAAVLRDEFESSLLEMIEPVGTLSAEESVRVYQSDYVARMMEALGQNYEATWVLLGDEDFFSFGKKYIDSHPSSFQNLTSYGHEFDAFLASNNAETEVIQMASFEKAFWKFFHQRPTVKRLFENIEEVKLEYNYYLSSSEIKLYDLWMTRESPPDSLEAFLEQEYLCMFKKESKVEVLKVSELQHEILSMLKEQRSLSNVITQTEELGINTTEDDWAKILEICLWN